MYQVKLQTYPNREARVTLSSLPPVKKAFESKRGKSVSQESATKTCETETPLTLNPNSKRGGGGVGDAPQAGYGGLPRVSRFGNNGRRTILRAGGALELHAGSPEECVTFTLTCPGSTDAALEAFSRWSAYFVHRIKAWVAKRVADKQDFYVWERQRRGALHLHYCVWIHESSIRKYVISNWRAQATRLIDDVCVKSGVDCWGKADGTTHAVDKSVLQAYAQPLYKSVAAYFAKYCGKSVNSHGFGSNQKLYYPTRWWGVSRPLLKILRENTFERVFYTTNYGKAYRKYEDLSQIVCQDAEKYYSYRVKFGRGEVTTAYANTLQGYWLWTMTEMPSSQPIDLSNSLRPSVWTITTLNVILRRYSLAPGHFSSLSTPYLETAVAKLYDSQQLNIGEAMEISHAMRLLLQSRYHDRNHVPSSYPRDVKILNQLWGRLRFLRVSRELSPEEPLDSLD